MSGIFINYRRSDSAGHTGRLVDDLSVQLDSQSLFRDIEAIEVGVDFVQALERAVSGCAVMLVVIGPSWATASTYDGQKRLFQTDDFVRMEIEAALQRDIRVIPVLVGDAQMPGPGDVPDSMSALLRRNAYAISDRRWKFDVAQLVDILLKIPGVAGRTDQPASSTQTGAARKTAMSIRMKATMAAIVAVAVIAAGATAVTQLWPDKSAVLASPTVPLVVAPITTATPVAPVSAEPDITVPTSDPVETVEEQDNSAFYGDWVSADGEVFNIGIEDDAEHNVSVFGGKRMDNGTARQADTPPVSEAGQDIYGLGNISARLLKATLFDMFSEDIYDIELELSASGDELKGYVSASGSDQKIDLLLRRKE
jgi:hypothetical protein